MVNASQKQKKTKNYTELCLSVAWYLCRIHIFISSSICKQIINRIFTFSLSFAKIIILCAFTIHKYVQPTTIESTHTRHIKKANESDNKHCYLNPLFHNTYNRWWDCKNDKKKKKLSALVNSISTIKDSIFMPKYLHLYNNVIVLLLFK